MKFKNRKSLDKILKDMPLAVKEVAHKNLEEGGDDITATMRRLAPVSTGDLRSTIRHEDASSRYRLGRVIMAGGIYNGVKVAYARIAEFHYNKAFFVPAFRAHKRRIKSRLTRSVNKAMKQTIQKNRKG